MSKCTVESWKMKEIATALKDKSQHGKRIVIPRFQRGKRWSDSQEIDFIDSLRRGYPVGTLLFYRTIDSNAVESYTLVDGLQRSTAIARYLDQPMQYFEEEGIPDDLLDKLCFILGYPKNNDVVRHGIKTIVFNYIHGLASLEGEQSFSLASLIIGGISTNKEKMDLLNNLMSELPGFLKSLKSDYEIISETEIPAVVYSGLEEELPRIFERINSKGTPLNPYEIYAASWPQTEKYTIKNEAIVKYVLDKYDALNNDIYTLKDYDRGEIYKQKRLTVFEYCFGLGKWLNSHFPILAFDKSTNADEILTIGFDLLDSCLFDTKNIGGLHKEIIKFDINQLEKCLVEAIGVVTEIITPIIKFKGNSRSQDASILYSKNQIVSMIGFVFREKFSFDDLTKDSDTWNDKKDELKNRMYRWFVFDILRKEWFDGGGGKIHSAINGKKYFETISPTSWDSTLDAMFEDSLNKKETTNVKKPSTTDIVFLNTIYVSKFSAMDQLSSDKFDIEHIAPKDMMKQFIRDTCPNDYLEGLPIGSIANLCYLPEYQNRSKGSKTFYQDTGYLRELSLSDIETKYSFTTKKSLEWADLEYEMGDFDDLKGHYIEFLKDRFKKQKHEFFVTMNIDEKDILQPAIASNDTNRKAKTLTQNPFEKASEIYLGIKERLENAYKTKLTIDEKIVASNNDKRYLLTYSKMYQQGRRHKYWFAFRPERANMGDQKEKFHVFSCNEDGLLFVIPIEVLNQAMGSMNQSKDRRKVIYYHVVFFVDILEDGKKKAVWMLSKPEIREEDLSKYLVQ